LVLPCRGSFWQTTEEYYSSLEILDRAPSLLTIPSGPTSQPLPLVHTAATAAIVLCHCCSVNSRRRVNGGPWLGMSDPRKMIPHVGMVRLKISIGARNWLLVGWITYGFHLLVDFYTQKCLFKKKEKTCPRRWCILLPSKK
jgi:hypothetical protein